MDIVNKISLNLETCTVYGKGYYTIKPIFNDTEYRAYYMIETSKTWDSMVEWCVNMFGPVSIDVTKPGIWNPDQPWYVNNAKFFIRDEKTICCFY